MVFGAAGAPERFQLARGVVVAPAEAAGRRMDGGAQLRERGAGDRAAGRLPVHRQVPLLGEQLLEAEERRGRDGPVEGARGLRDACGGGLGDGHREPQLQLATERDAETGGDEDECVAVLLVPVPVCGRREGRVCGAEDGGDRLREDERDRVARRDRRARGRPAEHHGQRGAWEPADPDRRPGALPRSRRRGDIDRAGGRSPSEGERDRAPSLAASRS